MSRVRLAGQPAVCPSVLRGKNFNVGFYTQTFQPNLFIPAMFTGTIDFYHLIPLSLTSTLGGGRGDGGGGGGGGGGEVTRSAESKTS